MSNQSSFLQCLFQRIQEQNIMETEDVHPVVQEDHDTNNAATLRMSILGPSQSAKTSLAMDFAYSVATTAAANTTTATAQSESGLNHNDDDDDDDDDNNGQGVVLFIIPQCKRALLDFPLHCSRTTKNNKNHGHDTHVHDQQQQGEYYSWNQRHKQGLEKIQIKYMASVTDLVYFLASLGKKFHCHGLMNANVENDCHADTLDHYRRLDAIVIDDLDCYIRPQGDVVFASTSAAAGHDGEVEKSQRYNGGIATTTTTTTTTTTISKAASMTSLEMQKLIQLLALIADTANWMDEIIMSMQNRTRSPHPRKGIHVVTCINTDRLPLGTSMSSIKGIMSMMQNYTPSIVHMEQMMEYRTVQNDDKKSINLDSFFHKNGMNSRLGKDSGERMVKLLSAWKVTLYHHDHARTERSCVVDDGKRQQECRGECLESRFCVAMRCWDDELEQNLLSYMEESVTSRRNNDEEDEEEEYELFWDL